MQNESIQNVTAQNFDAEVLGSDLPVLVDFTTAWCGPCKALTPIMARIAAEGRVKVVAVDGDEHPELTARFGIRGYPTVIAFGGGRELARNLGLAPRERLLRLLDAHAVSASR